VMDLRELCEKVNWIHLARDMQHRWALVNTLMNLPEISWLFQRLLVSQGICFMKSVTVCSNQYSVPCVTEYGSPQGRAMAKAVSRRPLTAEVRVCAQVNPCGICGGQSGTGTGFPMSYSIFPCQYQSTVALQTHIIWGMNNMSDSGRSSET
jgi:hypothetical protein